MTDLSRDLLIGCVLYVGLLLLLGGLGRRARRENTLSDHFLAGRSIGPFVLLLTLFATQYSGNSLSGFPGQTYREGLSYFMSVTFMVGIISGYMLFAPRLFGLSRSGRFLTPTDFLDRRFGSPLLNYLSAIIFTFVLCNYMLAQLKAMGNAFSGLTQDQIPFWAGVVGGAAVILVYEFLGGMRAVAWTDALQGTILIVGLLMVAGLLMGEVGSPAEVVATVREVAPQKVASPDLTTCLVWLSNFVLLGLGAPLYPQAIQRIYAARSLGSLRSALSVMAVLPLVAITTVVFIGVAGIAMFPDLDAAASDKITFLVLGSLVERQPLAYFPAIIVMLAVFAAIMSTTDSCLLSLTSILTKDFTARIRGLSAERAERLTRLAPAFSLVTMALLIVLALKLRTTLWGLLVIKFEILIQLSPAFVLGTLHDRDDPRAFASRDVLAGLLAGLATFVVLYTAGLKSVHGLHAGSVGVVVNYLVVFLARAVRQGQAFKPSSMRLTD